ncbi:unnamed protein product [Rotaria sp. Silwood1]|nr:unnamed protein product [Rotaria sp. Silwood1]
MTASKPINRRLVSNIRDEPEQMLKPIAGYELEPLLSLEEACKPLKNILDHELQQNISVAKMNSKEPKHGLKPDESAAIHLYTMEWDVRENSLYMILNQTLRSADRTQLRPWFRYLKLFLTGLYKLPPTEYQTVWRGIPENLSALYPRGKEFTWWALSSCTSSISVLESPLYVGTSGPRTMFSIETNSGKLIREHSYFQHEDEILLPPGRYFKVIDKSSPAQDLHIIHLREIQPPHAMLAEPFDLSEWKRIPSPRKLLPNSSKKHEITSTASDISKPVAKAASEKNFITKQIEKKTGMDLNGDGVIGYGRGGYGGGYGQGHGAGGGLINQLEKATHMDLNGDGRVGGGYGHAPPYNQYGPPGYPPQYNQYGGAPPCPSNYGPYGGPPNYNQYGGAPYPPQVNQYGGPGYGAAPYHGGSSGGGGLINQLEKATGMDLNGDGRVGGSGYRQPHNPYGHPY